ncbi:MAG: hypothetical protein ABI921_11750 [Panacibacter sp.]
MNIKTTIEEWQIKDLEDNSVIRIHVEHDTEMGNNAVPGIQVWCSAGIVNYEPLHTERWAYAAQKTNKAEYLIEDASWMIYKDTYIKNSLIIGEKLKAKVEVRVRSSSKPVIKEYELPFAINLN